MKIFFVVLCNAAILFTIAWLLPYDAVKQSGVMVSEVEAWKTYVVGGIILGFLVSFVRPIFRFIGLPFQIVFFGLVTLAINLVILWLFTSIFSMLNFSNISYEIKGIFNFIIAVAIFTVFNTLYDGIFNK